MIKKIIASSGVLLASLLAVPCFAAADQTVLDAATTTAQTISDNLTAAVSGALPIVVVPGIFIVVIIVVWRLGRRFVGR